MSVKKEEKGNKVCVKKETIILYCGILEYFCIILLNSPEHNPFLRFLPSVSSPAYADWLRVQNTEAPGKSPGASVVFVRATAGESARTVTVSFPRLATQLGYRLGKMAKSKPRKKIPEPDAIFELLHAINQAADETAGVLRFSMYAQGCLLHHGQIDEVRYFCLRLSSGEPGASAASPFQKDFELVPVGPPGDNLGVGDAVYVAHTHGGDGFVGDQCLLLAGMEATPQVEALTALFVTHGPLHDDGSLNALGAEIVQSNLCGSLKAEVHAVVRLASAEDYRQRALGDV